MSKKGQTCNNCAGDCCKLWFKTTWPPELAKQYPTGTDERKEFFMFHSISELKALDIVILGEMMSEDGSRCASQLEDGRCPYHGKDKPKLCKSYYCGGKYWRLREDCSS